jgi:hypothetical protein
MHHSVYTRMQNFFKGGAVGELGFDELGTLRDQRAMAVAKIVVDYNLMPVIEKQLGDGSTDVAGSAGDENSHGFTPCLEDFAASSMALGSFVGLQVEEAVS